MVIVWLHSFTFIQLFEVFLYDVMQFEEIKELSPPLKVKESWRVIINVDYLMYTFPKTTQIQIQNHIPQTLLDGTIRPGYRKLRQSDDGTIMKANLISGELSSCSLSSISKQARNRRAAPT